VQRLERGCDLLHEVEVDRSETARIDIGLGLTQARSTVFIRSDVQERPGYWAASSVNSCLISAIDPGWPGARTAPCGVSASG